MKVFISAAKNLNFTKAAEEMYVTQSSISKIIKSLEDECGTQLFYRTPTIKLTDSGKELYKQSINIMSQLERIPNEINSITKLKKGEINIGIPPIMGASFFPGIIGGFKAKYPNIKIKLMEVGSKLIVNKMEEGELDIGIVCSFPKEKNSYNMFQFIKSPLMVGINKGNSLSDMKSINFKDLKDEHFILFHQDFTLYDQIMTKCMENGFEPNVICNSSQRDFIIEMVAENLGITFLPKSISDKIERDNIRFIPIEGPQIYLNLLVIWKKDRYVSYASKEWLKFAASKIGIDLK